MARLQNRGGKNPTPPLQTAVIGNTGKQASKKSTKVVKTKPVGQPYKDMTDRQAEIWFEIIDEMPWINSGHRRLVRQLCVLHERDEVMGLPANQLGHYIKILQLLGATPVDAAKLSLPDDQMEDPIDQFFAHQAARGPN